MMERIVIFVLIFLAMMGGQSLISASAGTRCIGSWDCPTDEICRLTTRMCVPLECEYNFECADGQLCNNGLCLADITEDNDYDGVPDALDNCLPAINPSQRDGNFDGVGDACANEIVGLNGSGGPNNRGSGNTVLGHSAFSSAAKPGEVKGKTSVLENTAIGALTLWGLKTGRKNTAVGSMSLRHLGIHTTRRVPESNTAVGQGSLYTLSTGSNNLALGVSAGKDLQSGLRNTVVGTRGLANLREGGQNIAIGYEAGRNLVGRRCSNNIYLGNQVGPQQPTCENNKLYIGSSAARSLITGDFVTAELTIHGSLHATGNVTTSDARLKKDIQPLTHALDAILQLQGKTYRWKEDTTFANKQDIGLVAQEVEEIFPELVAENEQGYKGIAYSKLTAVLIEAIKEQQQLFTAEMTALQKENIQFTGQIATLEKENTQLKTIMAEQMQVLLARVVMLEGETLASN